MAGMDDDTDLAIVFVGLCAGALAAFSLGSSVAVGTLLGGVIAQGVVLLRRHDRQPRSS